MVDKEVQIIRITTKPHALGGGGQNRSTSTNIKDIEAEVSAAFSATVRETRKKAGIGAAPSIAAAAASTGAAPARTLTRNILTRSGKTSDTAGAIRTASALSVGRNRHTPDGGSSFSGGRTGSTGGGRSSRSNALVPSPYEEEKARLKEEAEAEFSHNVMDWGQTAIRNFAVNPDLPQTAGLINYLQLLLQSPKGLEYERYTAEEQEAEKAQRLEEITAWANENGHSPLLSKLYGKDTTGILNLPSALSLVTSPFRGAEYVLDALETAYTGAPLPGSTPDFTETTQALRDGVSRDMTETGRFFYDTAMSAADSLAANTLGRGSAGGAVLLGLGGASDTAHDIIDRGGTEEQALIGGAISGILEGVFETFSLSQLESMKALPVSTTKDTLTNIAKSVVTNAGEEGLTELAGTIFDTIFMDELSAYSLTVQGYLSQGKSQADAEKLARQELFARICESAASGALMGVLFGGGASAGSYYRSRLASQGEARMRSGQLPTDAELDAMNLSESEALGEMVLLQMEGMDDTGVDEAANAHPFVMSEAEGYTQKQKEIQALVLSQEITKSINKGHQNKHIKSSNGYISGRSYIYGNLEDAQALVDRYHGSGKMVLTRRGEWANKEIVLAKNIVGVNLEPESGTKTETRRFTIHYGKKGVHIVPIKEIE